MKALNLGQRRVRNRGLRIASRVAIAVLAVVLLAAALFVLSQRNVTTPVTKGEALRRFRATRSQEDAATQSTAPTTPEAPPSTAVAAHFGAPVPAKRPGVTPAGAAPASPAAHPLDGVAGYTAPAEGVYSYRATGGDSISLAGASHTYPSEVYDTVTHAGGCLWRSQFDIAKENQATRTLCGEPGRLSLLEDKRQVTYFGQTETEDARCHPPILFHDVSETPGSTFSTACDSSDTHIEATSTYVGHEAVTVGSSPVDAVRLKFHGTLTGRANGTADEQLWIVPQTGLVLRWDRAEDAEANAAFGANIHYHEKASFLLESLTPST